MEGCNPNTGDTGCGVRQPRLGSGSSNADALMMMYSTEATQTLPQAPPNSAGTQPVVRDDRLGVHEAAVGGSEPVDRVEAPQPGTPPAPQPNPTAPHRGLRPPEQQ